MLEFSWLLKPLLRHVGADLRIARLVDERLGPSTVEAIVCGAKLRVPRLTAFELLEELAKQTGAPHLGLKAMGHRPPETLLDYLFVTSATLGDALQLLTATNRLNNDARFELEMHKRVILRQHIGTDQARQFTEGAAATLVQTAVASLDPSWAPLEVRFPHSRPARLTLLEDHFRCPISFGAPSFELHVAREDCATPMRRSEPTLNALLMSVAAEQLAVLPRPADSAASATRLILGEALRRRRDANIDAIADQLRIGVRTLQRRLREEGTDYRRLLDDARRELTLQLLAEGTRELVEVASVVGLDSLSSLHRAVRRWTGRTPSALRKSSGA